MMRKPKCVSITVDKKSMIEINEKNYFFLSVAKTASYRFKTYIRRPVTVETASRF